LSKSNSQKIENTVAILIHGTWGSNSRWHQPGNIFYETIKSHLLKEQIKLISFNWSGKLCYIKRQEAGVNLANLIHSYPASTNFILISHSHGGNVGIIASQILTTPDQIKSFYSLGLPIDTQNYLPNMQVVQNFYHIFSFGDIHQTVFGMHERIFPNLKGVYNINVEVNGIRPQHEDLHVIQIAKWLLEIDQVIKNFKNHSNHFFVKLYDNCKPAITLDNQIKQKLDYDKHWHERIQTSLLSPYSSGRGLTR